MYPTQLCFEIFYVVKAGIPKYASGRRRSSAVDGGAKHIFYSEHTYRLKNYPNTEFARRYIVPNVNYIHAFWEELHIKIQNIYSFT